MNVIHAGNLMKLPHVEHGFFTRQGGVSKGVYASLNAGLNTHDSKADIHENRRRIQDHLEARELISLNQIHSADVIRLETPWQESKAPQADALVTTKTNIAIAVHTADCVPVLFADTKKNIVGIAHAGWRGALDGVIENTISQMRVLGADNILAAMGPAIGAQSYEVNMDFLTPFLAQDDANHAFFSPATRKGHLMFDLPAYIGNSLQAQNITGISKTGHDTYTEEELFFSHRRSTHKGEPDCGRQLSVIVLK